MRHSRRNALITAVVAGGGLAVAGVGGLAYADADAGGRAAGSPGLLAGNLVQLPVNTPVNVCGNTVSVVGLLNPAAGNRCATTSQGGGARSGSGASGQGHSSSSTKAGTANGGGAVAGGQAAGSPGLLSGNGIQLPVDLPLNVSGNSVNVVGIGNPSSGNTSVNGVKPSGGKPVQPPVVVKPPVVIPPAPVTQVKPPAPQTPQTPPRHTEALAHTGSDGLGYLIPGSGALLLGGALMYRRFRTQGSV
ncbi:chaplin [Streptomyces sp. CA-243310]|uniref:chaplin n=1 Tax=Streptomyces sp. CA-243310 TaxID=3240056 RepID=UPI003D91B2FA